MIARAAFHFQRHLVQILHRRLLGQPNAAKEPVGEQLLLVRRKLHHLAIQVGVVLLLELVEVVEFGFVEPLEHRALLRRARRSRASL